MSECDEEPEEDVGHGDFNVRDEIVKTYRMAKENVDLRLKALTLLLKVDPPAPGVKPGDADDDEEDTRSSVQKAHQKLNGTR
jgi:hypothetical protein